MTDTRLSKNLNLVRLKIKQFAQKHQRCADDVRLIAVSKTRTAQELHAAAQLGQIDFGENYVQEAVNKIIELSDLKLTWHFIGPIQKNKTKLIAEHFHWVHSIDRTVIATRLNNQRSDHQPRLNVCIQINIDEEQTKSGIRPDDLLDLAHHIGTLPKLALRGLMAIPTASEDFDQQCATFNKIQRLFKELQVHSPESDTLSMGMSNDYEAAIACGTTTVRIGTAIFGSRQYT